MYTKCSSKLRNDAFNVELHLFDACMRAGGNDESLFVLYDEAARHVF